MADSADNTPRHVLLVEAERAIAALIAFHLARQGVTVSIAANDTEARACAAAQRPDLLVLDGAVAGARELIDALAPASGPIDASADAREHECAPLVYLATGRDDAERIGAAHPDRLVCLRKPFSPHELAARARALLRGAQDAPMADGGRLLRAGPVEVDLAARRVTVAGRAVALTRTEHALLVALLEAGGRVQTRKELLAAAWGVRVDIETRTVDMYVQRLRQKLGAAGERVETARGAGYRFRQ